MKTKNKKIIFIPKEENIIDYNEIVKILCENMNNYIKRWKRGATDDKSIYL